MKILGIDSSAKSASAAVLDNNKIIAHFYINTGLTHSQTLMPMLESVLLNSGTKLTDIDLVAVNKGPGSFTGIRIGVAAAKGICDPLGIKICGTSTLESMAYNLISHDCIACAVMDARCSQVYTALFDVSDGRIIRLTDDAAMSLDELSAILKEYDKQKILVGDGADLCYNYFGLSDESIKLAQESERYQNAVGVCLSSLKHTDEYIGGNELVPEYLRLPQAERELKNKFKG